ncbi:MAG: isopeptide-forming domain-containing fimbrial protein, partial [Clostridia bacterium]|nr:isopeptide-forming domain-containing fimbrial protein [Clostridia bacterium]
NVDAELRHDMERMAQMEELHRRETVYREAILANSAGFMEVNLSRDEITTRIFDEEWFSRALSYPGSSFDGLSGFMAEGLTFKEIASVTTEDGNVPFILSPAAPTKDDRVFTVTFTEDTVKACRGKKITIEYSAVLNEKAAVGRSDSLPETPDGNTNTVYLTYGNDYESMPKTVETDTQQFTFDKTDGNDPTVKLSGAVFRLRKDGAYIPLIEVEPGITYRVATEEETADASVETVLDMTTNGHVVTVIGIAGDEEYSLVEMKAPEGYSLPADPAIPVEKSTLNDVSLVIENSNGIALPKTGGPGTVPIYAAGIALSAAASAAFAWRKKRG